MEARFLPLSACHLEGQTQTFGVAFDARTQDILGLQFRGQRGGWVRLHMEVDGVPVLPPELRHFSARKVGDGRLIWPKGLRLQVTGDHSLPDGLVIGAVWERTWRSR